MANERKRKYPIMECQTYEELKRLKNFKPSMIKLWEDIIKYTELPRTSKPEVYWFYGETGTGKTNTAREMTSGRRTYFKCCNRSKFFHGYDGHDCAILDNFTGTGVTAENMTGLLDGYDYRVETEDETEESLQRYFEGKRVGPGSRQWKPNIIIVTSRYEPRKYATKYTIEEQIIRRIDRIVEFKRNQNLEIITTTIIK